MAAGRAHSLRNAGFDGRGARDAADRALAAQPLRPSWATVQARGIAILAPPVYTLVLWLAMNWMIMGDPLYFQRSVFSLPSAPDVARNIGPVIHCGCHGFVERHHRYSLRRLTQANLAFPVLWVVAVLLGIFFASGGYSVWRC